MWWPDRTHWRVGLSMHSLVRLQAGAPAGRRLLGGDRTVLDPEEGSAPWQGGVSALRRLLAAAGSGAPPEVHVTLSGAFARWELLPWNPAIGSEVERAAYARLCFEKSYGGLTRDWTLRQVDARPGAPTLACAIDSALVDALQRTCTEAGARLRSVAPYFSAAAQRWRGRLPGRAGWFGTMDDDAVVLAAWQGGAWRGVHVRRQVADPADALPGMLEQLATGLDLDAAALPLFLASSGAPVAVRWPVVPVWLAPDLKPAQPVEGVRLALGL